MLSVVYVIYKSPVHYFTVSFKMVRLTKEQVQFYKDNGYIHLKNLIKGEELKRVSEEYDDLFKRKNQAKTESSWVGSDDTFRASDSPYTVRFFYLYSVYLNREHQVLRHSTHCYTRKFYRAAELNAACCFVARTRKSKCLKSGNRIHNRCIYSPRSLTIFFVTLQCFRRL